MRELTATPNGLDHGTDRSATEGCVVRFFEETYFELRTSLTSVQHRPRVRRAAFRRDSDIRALDATRCAMSGAHPAPTRRPRTRVEAARSTPASRGLATRPEDEKCKADDTDAEGGGERPRLRLIRASTSQLDEHQHPARERDEGCSRYDMFRSAAEHAEDEHLPQNQPSRNRAQNDEPDVAPTSFVLDFRNECARCLGRRRRLTTWSVVHGSTLNPNIIPLS